MSKPDLLRRLRAKGAGANWTRRGAIVAAAVALVVLISWLVFRGAGPSTADVPFSPGAQDQRVVSVGGERVDLEEVERAAAEADAIARELEAELGQVQPGPPR